MASPEHPSTLRQTPYKQASDLNVSTRFLNSQVRDNAYVSANEFYGERKNLSPDITRSPPRNPEITD